jgi:hypothetical protein
MITTVSRWRRQTSRVGYVGVFVLLALHVVFWRRADALGGFWGHFNEASRWFQAIALASLLVILCCFFGVGWKRWAGVGCGLASLAMCFLYGAGL